MSNLPMGGRPYTPEDRTPHNMPPQYRDFDRGHPPFPTTQQTNDYDPYGRSPHGPAVGPERTPFHMSHPPSHGDFSPQERLGRYLPGPAPPAQHAAAFLMRNGEDLMRNNNGTRSLVKMEHATSLQMGQSSFGDEDFLVQQKRYASHPSPFSYAPPQPPSRSPLHPLPPNLNHHTIPPHPPLPTHHPPPPPQPSFPQPSASSSPHLHSYPSPSPSPSPASVEKSSFKTLIESPGGPSHPFPLSEIDTNFRCFFFPLPPPPLPN